MEDNAKVLYAELQEKVGREYNEYIKSLHDMTADEIIEKSYETVMLQEFKTVIEKRAENRFGIDQLHRLLQIDNVLDTLYQDWLQFDSDEMDVYEEFVLGYWDFT